LDNLEEAFSCHGRDLKTNQEAGMTPHSSDRTRCLLDSVHGLVWLTPEEVEIIDHPLFQRLRGIKQNGLLHLVFPPATHTRFEHSIGTIFVASSMLDAIWRNSIVAGSKSPPGVVPIKQAEPGQAIKFPELNDDELRTVYRITRLAALVHDLGHGPLSHTFDAFAPTPEVVRKALQDPQVRALQKLESAFDVLRDRRYGKIKHEAMSCLFFAAIWRDRDPEILIAVCAAILGEQVSSSVTPRLRPWVTLAHDLIASAPADADRMDYLERDSRSLGVTYGLFDRNRVLKTLLCYLEDRFGERRYRLGLKKSGMRAIENLLQARFEMYVQVYYHKTNRAIFQMLETIAEDGKQRIDLWPRQTFTDIANRYLAFSDEQFLRILCGDTEQVVPDSVKSLARQVANRQLWKRIVDCEYNKAGPKETREDAKREKANLQTRFPDEPLRLDFADPEATKGLEQGARLLARQRPGGVYALTDSGIAWEDVSPIIQALSKREQAIARIFLCKNDETIARKIRFQNSN